MVGERGFEPPTPWSRTRCSTRLSHSPTSLERNEHPRQTVEKRAVTTHSVVIITFALLRPSCEVECAALVDSVHDAATVSSKTSYKTTFTTSTLLNFKH